MKIKMSILLFTVTFFIVTVLSGCSGTENNEPNETSETSADSADDRNISEFIGDHSEKVVIKYYRGSQAVKTIEELEPYKKFLEEKFNVDWQVVPLGNLGEQYQQTLNTRLASGDVADIIMYPDPLQFNSHAEQGYLLALNPYQEQLENVYTNLSPDLIKATKFTDGNTYGMPMRTLVASTLWIRQDWLDALNLEAPTNMEELYQVAKAFTEQDPDGNGKDDTFGMSGASAGQDILTGLEYIYGGFGIYDRTYMFQEDGQAKFAVTSPRMKDALEYTSKMVKENNIIDPEFFLNDANTYLQKAVQGKIGIYQKNYAFVAQNEKEITEINPEANWVPLSFPTGPEGSGVGTQKNTAYIALSSELEDDPVKLARIIEMIQWFTSEEGHLYANFGIEGENYRMENDKVEVIGEWEDPKYYTLHLGPIENASELAAIHAYGEETGELLGKELEAFGQQPISIFHAVNPMEGSSDLLKYIEQELAAFVFGEKPLSEWDDFVKEAESTYQLREIEADITEQARNIGLID